MHGARTIAVAVFITHAAVPVITSFEPGSAVAGNEVRSPEKNFSPKTTGNIVYFGSVARTRNCGQQHELKCASPAGATSHP